MRSYLKKKFYYVNVHGVFSLTKKRGREIVFMMEQIHHRDCIMEKTPQSYTITGVPEGRYCLVSDGILLPKRRRGEKFIVRYTQMFEKEF